MIFPIALLFSIALGFLAGVQGWRGPQAAQQIVDTVAAVSAILTGVSLAIVAILSQPTPRPLDKRGAAASKVASQNDVDLVNQQIFVFLGFFANLFLAVLLKYVGVLGNVDWASFGAKLLGALFLGTLAYSLCLALTLPFLLKRLIEARRSYH